MPATHWTRSEPLTWAAACLLTVGCADLPTAPDPAHPVASVALQGALPAKSGDRGGKPAPAYITHPLRVTLADRPGDNYTSDGGGPYADDLDGTWVITDYADPLRPDHFQFISEPGGDRVTTLTVPGVVPSTDCGGLRFSVRDRGTPDLYATADGWVGTGSGTLLCGKKRGGYRLEIGECVAVTRGSAGQWAVAADQCATEVWEGNIMLGTFPFSFAFDAVEL